MIHVQYIMYVDPTRSPSFHCNNVSNIRYSDDTNVLLYCVDVLTSNSSEC